MSYKKFVLGSLVLVAVIVTAFAVADAKKGDRPPAAPAQKAFLGVYLQDLDQDTQEALDLDSKEGVLIEDVVEESPADQADLQEQDIIISLDGQKVESSEELKKAIAKDSKYAKTYRLLGVAYNLLGKEKNAVEVFERFVKLDPGHKEIPKIKSFIADYYKRNPK